ncbi:MAG: Gfo/Idh/MocA family protein [Nostoc sp.]
MNKKIGVGIIGANPDRGWAQAAHIPALFALPQYEIRAISTSQRQTATAAKERFNLPLAFDNYTELVTHPDVDLVTIAVKVPHHRELVTAAIKAGKHIYCEWPLGNSLAETVELADLARTKNIHTAIGLQGRAAPVINWVRDLIAQGYIGTVLSTSMVASGEYPSDVIDSANTYMLDKQNGANLLTIHSGHYADVITYCLGEFIELNATLATQRRQVKLIETGEMITATSPDQVVINGILNTKAVASLHLRGGHSRGTNLLWEINGTEGDLLLTGDIGYINMLDVTLQGARGKEDTLSPISIPDQYRWVPLETPKGSPFNVAQLYTQLARDILEGTNFCSGFDAAVIRHRMLDAIQTAADSGTRQTYKIDL